jgi:hypothetical protein
LLEAVKLASKLLLNSTRNYKNASAILIYFRILISHSKLTPCFSFTNFFTSLPRLIKSLALAFPRLIIKLQCFSEICASPIIFPRAPAASINSHAFFSGGFLKVLPPVLARIGCAFSRCLLNSKIFAPTSSTLDFSS